MWSRLEPWGGVGRMSARRCEESYWHACGHGLSQDESKYAQASGVREAAVPSGGCRATKCRVPDLHWGQDRLSADFWGSLSSALMSETVTPTPSHHAPRRIPG
jgi:hypothetical protein